MRVMYSKQLKNISTKHVVLVLQHSAPGQASFMHDYALVRQALLEHLATGTDSQPLFTSGTLGHVSGPLLPGSYLSS